tara:strand:- start:4189 stop:4539 length:351 start_codon:yes stop_codon:yes gene_type:complete
MMLYKNLLVGMLFTCSCAPKHTNYGALEGLAGDYLENQRISSEMLLVAAKNAPYQDECRRFAGAAFWLRAIAKAETEYQLWLFHPYRFLLEEPDPTPRPESSYDFCIKHDLRETSL